MALSHPDCRCSLSLIVGGQASDGLEIPCWNGEVVRIAFAIDTHDREIITWVATHGSGISGALNRRSLNP